MTTVAEGALGRRPGVPRDGHPRPAASPRRVLTLTVVDQGASSVSNFLLSVVVAHYSGARPLGVFSLVMATYIVAQGLVRAFTSDCLLTRVDPDGDARRRSEAGGYLTAAALGLVMGLGVLVASALATPDFRLPLVLLAVCLPLLAMQDFARYVGIHRGEPGYAVWLDLAWVVLFVVGFAGLQAAGLTSLPWLFGAWTVAGAAVGVVTAGRHLARPAGDLVRSWVHQERSVGTHFAGQFLVSSMSSYLVFYLLALFVVSVATVGVVKLALLALGPATVMTAGLQIGLIGLAATRMREGTGRALRFLAVAGAGMGAAIVVSAAVVYLIPAHDMGSVLGPTWPQARPLIPVGGLAVAATAVAGAAGVGLRALRAGKQILWVTLANVPVVVGLPIAGAAVDGAQGYVVAALACNAIFAVTSWVVLVRTARTARVPAPGRSPSVEHDGGPAAATATVIERADPSVPVPGDGPTVRSAGAGGPWPGVATAGGPDEVGLPPALVAAASAADGLAMARAAATGRPPVDRLATGAGAAATGAGERGAPEDTVSPFDGEAADRPAPAEGAGTAELLGADIPGVPQKRTRLLALGLVAAAAVLLAVDMARMHTTPSSSSAAGPAPAAGAPRGGRHHAGGAAQHPTAPATRAAGSSSRGGAGSAGTPRSTVAPAAGSTAPPSGAPSGAPAPSAAPASAAPAWSPAPTLCDAGDLAVSTVVSGGPSITVTSTLTATRACTFEPVSAGQLGNCPTELSVTDASASAVWPTADRTESCAVPPSGSVAAGPVATVSGTWNGQVDGPGGSVPLPAGSYTAVGSWAVQTASGPVVVQGTAPLSVG